MVAETRRPAVLIHVRITVSFGLPISGFPIADFEFSNTKSESANGNQLGASPLFHQDLELDALTLDDDPPRLDFEDAERRDDVPFGDQTAVDHRVGLAPHERALQ